MTTLEQIKSRVSESDKGCWIWLGCRNPSGYGNLRSGGKGYLVHRYVAALVGMEIEGRNVLHKCDNPPCCNPDHLFVGTQKDNMLDAKAKGRMRSGETCNLSSLTSTQVQEIRKRYLAGDGTQQTLADEYGITRSGIAHIVTNKTWKTDGPSLNFGSRRGYYKLTPEQVLEIRKKYKEANMTYKQLSIEYGVHKVTIRDIITRKLWKHI